MLVLRIASGESGLENLKRYLFSIVLLKVTKTSTWRSQQPNLATVGWMYFSMALLRNRRSHRKPGSKILVGGHFQRED